MADLSKKLNIVVVGGSLAGLMSAIPLKRLGHNVTILERSPTPLLHDQGAGIVAGGETQEFFHKHDLSRTPMAVTSQARYYLNQAGDIVDQERYQQRMTSWDLLYNLGRANFDAVKSDYVVDLPKADADDSAKYEYGRLVEAVRDAGERVEITFENTREGESSNAEDKVLADFLIVADGASSHLRPLLLPESDTRTFAGYVAFRGTVPEQQLSEAASSCFVERFTFFHGDGIQILAYTIPGQHGSLEKGHRLVNWVWYCNYDEDSQEYVELMTDTEGNRHRFTLPTGGKMQPQVWQKQVEQAKQTLSPQFAEIVEKTANPFVQAITDLEPPKRGTKVGRLLGGKAVLVGDALSGFRPHTAASTSQAAYHALLLEQVFKGKMQWDEYEEAVLDYAWSLQTRGVHLGNRSQFGHHPLTNKGNDGKEEVDRHELWMRKDKDQ